MPTYAIGFIRAYADYLGLDGERVLDSYREETADVQTRPDLTLPVPLGERSVPGGRVLLAGLVLALCGYGAWYYCQHRRARAPRACRRSAGRAAATDRAAAIGPGGSLRPTPIETAPVRPLRRPASSTRAGRGDGQLRSPAVPQARLAAAGASRPGRCGAAIGSACRAAASAAGPVAPAGGAVEPRSGTAARASDAASAGGSSRNPSPQAIGTPSGSIDIRALADCWIQIRDADQAIVFARVLKAGRNLSGADAPG